MGVVHFLVGSIGLLTVVGCPKGDGGGDSTGPTSTPTVSAPAPAPPPATVRPHSEAPPPSDPKIQWAGSWSSPHCGERKYERRVILEADGSAQVHDRVSPCPPDAHCVWSGIVHHEGRWEGRDGGVVLTLAAEGSAPQAAQLGPELSLRWEGRPVERDGGVSCPYERMSAR